MPCLFPGAKRFVVAYSNYRCRCENIGVSLNGGTPKSSMLIGFSIINHPYWGTTILGNPHISFLDHMCSSKNTIEPPEDGWGNCQFCRVFGYYFLGIGFFVWSMVIWVHTIFGQPSCTHIYIIISMLHYLFRHVTTMTLTYVYIEYNILCMTKCMQFSWR